MKHLLCLIVIIPGTIMAQLNQHTDQKSSLSKSDTPLAQRQNYGTSQRSNAVVLFEDFQSTDIPNIPEEWDGGQQVEQQLDNNDGIGLGIFVDAWKTGNAYAANNGGYLPVPHIANNIFAYANDDGTPCNCDMEDVGLITPELSFDGLNNMILTFDVYSQNTFGGDLISVQVSTDGEEFITLHTVNSSPEWQPIFVDLSLWDNEPSVWLRFAWSDNGYWSSGGAIDNVLVAENLEYNASILRAHTSEFSAEWDDTSIISGEYSGIPLEQAAPMTLGARIMNKGAMPLSNVVLSVTVNQGGVSMGSYNSQVIANMPSQHTQDIYITTDFIPDTPGEYSIEYDLIVNGDEDESDNTASRTVNYTPDVFVMDDGSADGFRNNQGYSFSIGNLFEIPNEGSICHSIGVGVGEGTIVGTEVEVRLYNTNNIYITGSEPYTITSADINALGDEKIVNIPLSSPELLTGGQDYLAVVSYFGAPQTSFVIANSGSSQQQFSVFEDEFGDWFYITTTPMVRLNLSATVNNQDLAKIENLRIYPNPVKDYYTLQSTHFQPGNIELILHSMSGREMARQSMRVSGNATTLINPLSLDQLAPGIYQLTVIQAHRHLTTRFLKVR